MFIVLEQQRASKDAVDNLGPPDESRMQAKMRARMSALADNKQPGIGE
jgi:hypothetical protein